MHCFLFCSFPDMFSGDTRLMNSYRCSVVSVWPLFSLILSTEAKAGICHAAPCVCTKSTNTRKEGKLTLRSCLYFDLNDVHFSWRFIGSFSEMGWTSLFSEYDSPGRPWSFAASNSIKSSPSLCSFCGLLVKWAIYLLQLLCNHHKSGQWVADVGCLYPMNLYSGLSAKPLTAKAKLFSCTEV